jgi:DNA/RNA endonuclease YhcR with UshA esterase domain
MRTAAALFLLCLPALAGADSDKPLSPAEAAKRVDQKCTVEMVVKSTGKARAGTPVFFNSEDDFRDKKNFTVLLDKEAVEKFKKAKVEDPAAHFKGKTVRVTGTVKLYRERPEIVVNDPGQIKVVEKKEPPPNRSL